MAEGGINPWVRSEQHLRSDETCALLTDPDQEHYEFIIDEIARTGAALNEALGMVAVRQTEHQVAIDARHAYFADRQNGYTHPA